MKTKWIILTTAMIAILSFEVIILTYQNRHARATVPNSLGRTSNWADVARPALEPGQRIETFLNLLEPLSPSGQNNGTLLSVDVKGKKKILFVFSTTCIICVRTIPAWVKVAKLVAGVRDVVVLGVSVHPRSLTEKFLSEREVEFPVYLAKDEFMTTFAVNSVPQTIILDENNRVRQILVGEIKNPQALMRYLE